MTKLSANFKIKWASTKLRNTRKILRNSRKWFNENVDYFNAVKCSWLNNQLNYFIILLLDLNSLLTSFGHIQRCLSHWATNFKFVLSTFIFLWMNFLKLLTMRLWKIWILRQNFYRSVTFLTICYQFFESVNYSYSTSPLWGHWDHLWKL